MRNLKILSAQPNDLYFIWQLRVQLHNFRKYNLSSLYHILVWYHQNRENGEDFQKEWDQLQADFPEAHFHFFSDPSGELDRMIKRFNYIPLLRPWLLGKFFSLDPKLSQEAILYMDSDVVFTRNPEFLQVLKDDDICYLSDTKSYIAASYFDSKSRDVLPDKQEQYKQVDVLNEVLQNFGLSREIAVANEQGSGGAQYLLKNIDAQFWQDVFKGCIDVKIHLQSINRRFFESEDKGFQSWCGDMWSVLFNLWRRGYKTECPKEMDFCWATDFIDKWDRVNIYHDAGATGRPIRGGHRLFHKREADYINNRKTPFEDDLSIVSNEYCSWHYARAIEEAKT